MADNEPVNAPPPTTGLPGWKLLPRFLLWLGGSTGVIGVVLTAFGSLVDYAYFDRLGVPRSLFEAAPNEYLMTGGKFLLGIVPLVLAGALQFCLAYWWLALATAVAAAFGWWRGSSNLRWLFAGVCLATAASLLALRFERQNGPDGPGVAMFTFIVAAACLFCYAEVVFNPAVQSPTPLSVSRYAFRVPFIALLICAVVVLPYLRGYYGLVRDYPVVQFLGKDKTFFCDLVAKQSPTSPANCDVDTWQLIEIGKDRSIVRRVADSAIYVVPSSSTKSFRIIGKELNP